MSRTSGRVQVLESRGWERCYLEERVWNGGKNVTLNVKPAHLAVCRTEVRRTLSCLLLEASTEAHLSGNKASLEKRLFVSLRSWVFQKFRIRRFIKVKCQTHFTYKYAQQFGKMRSFHINNHSISTKLKVMAPYQRTRSFTAACHFLPFLSVTF